MSPEEADKIRRLAVGWRTGADDVRRRFRTAAGVPEQAEAAADAMEQCSYTLEQFIFDMQRNAAPAAPAPAPNNPS